MSIATFGQVLVAMASYSRDRAEQRQDYLGKQNTALLYAISHTLFIGAKKCADLANEARHEHGDQL